MMLCKLSLKNIKKSFKDYAIYFFTLVLGVAIFYIFNALNSQTVMLDVSSNTNELIDLMNGMLAGVSVFVSFVLGFLIIYASRFLIKRRNKEFGVYLTLGMSKRKISMILFFETLFIGLVSLVVGLGIGIILSQGMSLVVANMFEAELTKFTFVFSKSAFIKTIICFGIMYLIVMIFNTVIVSKCKLIDLLNGAKKTEKVKLKNPIICILVFIVSAIILGIAYYRVTAGIYELETMTDILIIIAMGSISTFFIFWSISGLVLRIVKSKKNFYYKGLNSFTLRQFSGKINTTVFLTTIICLMLFITICMLSACLTVKNSLNKNLNSLSPVDAVYSATMNMENNYDYYIDIGYSDNQIKNSKFSVVETFNIYDYDILDDFKEYLEVNTYRTGDLRIKNTLGDLNVILPNNNKETIMKVSDYNKVAKMYGLKEYSLSDDEYIILANYKQMVEIRNYALNNDQEINLFGHTLKPKYSSCQDGFLDISSNRSNLGLILVSDSVIDEDYLYQNYLIGNYKTKDKKEIKALEDNITSLYQSVKTKDYLLPDISTKQSIKESTNGLSAMVTFIGLYLGIIFLISSTAILALKELSESSDNKERFRMLRRIGTDEAMINKALFKQIFIFFMLPMLLAIIHSIFGITFAIKILEVFGTEGLLESIIMTAIFIVLIYGGYFLITYYCSKNIIKENR